MRRSGTRWFRLPEPCAALLLAGLTLGCVSASSYDTIAEERDELRDQKERLEASSESAEKARVEALGQVEDLREERDRLSREAKKLERRVTELEAALRDQQRVRDAEASRDAARDARFAPVRAELEPEVRAEQVWIGERPDGLQVVVAEQALFAPGSGELTTGGRALLHRLALRVRDEDERVEVEGGADTPQLRLARGAAVMRALSQGGIPGEQLRAGSFVADEASESEAPQRRGVEIRLLPNFGAGAGIVDPAARPGAPATSVRP